MTELKSRRLLLRQWREGDLEPWAELNADAETMRYFPSTLTTEQSGAMACHLGELLRERGWGLWAVEVLGGPAFIGFVGLHKPSFQAHFTPAVEVGWRLQRNQWGNGYASEAASAALDFAFSVLELDEVVSFTSAINERSRAVMRRLGMTRDSSDDFDRPGVALGPLRRHVLYRLSADIWQHAPR